MGASPGPWAWGAGAGKWVLVDANDKPMLSFSTWSIEPGDMPLIAAAPEMAALLRELEWAGSGPVSECPECGGHPDRTRNIPGPPVPGRPGMVYYTGQKEIDPGGHTPDCRLGALLDRIGR